VQIDIPLEQMAEAGDPEQRGAWKMSVPTILAIVSGYTITMTSPKNVPLPTDVRPTMKPKTAPIATARICPCAGGRSRRRSAARRV